MARSLQTYKGLWQKALDVTAETPQPPSYDTKQCVVPAPDQIWQSLLEERQQLGEQLLFHPEIHAPRPGQLLRANKPWREWAHQRIFSLACLLNVQLPEEAWGRVKQPWHYVHYRLTCRVLVKLLEMYAGPSSLGWRRHLLNFFCYWPPAFVWHYERLLLSARAQRLKANGVGSNEAAV